MSVWVLLLVALQVATNGVRGNNDGTCESPCQRCPPCPLCPTVHCSSLPQIPDCPTSLVNLNCPPPPPCSCPSSSSSCPESPSCTCPSCPSCASEQCPSCHPAPESSTPPAPELSTKPPLGTYAVYQDKMTWFDANSTCGKDGSYLVIPDSLDELNHLLTIMEKLDIIYLHVGFHDNNHENEFHTVLGQPLNEVQQTFWSVGEPDGGRVDNCAFLHREYRRIFDEKCKNSQAFVCEK